MSDIAEPTAIPEQPAGQPVPPVARPWVRPVEVGTIAGVIALDQATKALVKMTLGLYEHVSIVPGLLDITHVRNTGAAFGLLNTADFPYKPLVMIVIAALALVAIGAYATQLGFHERLARIGLAMILGGAFGNLIDRAVAGHVTDFVDVYWANWHFWAFNVADAAITCGAGLVLLDMIGVGRTHASDPA
jgi:signal peptidase II